MSLSDNILTLVNQNIEIFVLNIIEKFNLSLDKQDLLNLWHSKSSCNNKSDEFDMKKILKVSKQELVAECKKRKLKVSGTKADLIQRLTGTEIISPKKKTLKKKKSHILTKIQTNQSQTIKIRKNKFGNYEHGETNFVLDKNTQNVIGKQNIDGTIEPLTPSNIDLCNKYKFSYEITAINDQKLDSENEIQELNSDFSEDYFSE